MRAVARRDGEEEFVVFAVGDRVVDLSAGCERQRVLVDLETESARAREAGKISAQAVAQVHHRVNAEIFCEPARFVNARDEAKMFASQRSAKFSSDEKIVAFFSAATWNRAIP